MHKYGRLQHIRSKIRYCGVEKEDTAKIRVRPRDGKSCNGMAAVKVSERISHLPATFERAPGGRVQGFRFAWTWGCTRNGPPCKGKSAERAGLVKPPMKVVPGPAALAFSPPTFAQRGA